MGHDHGRDSLMNGVNAQELGVPAVVLGHLGLAIIPDRVAPVARLLEQEVEDLGHRTLDFSPDPEGGGPV